MATAIDMAGVVVNGITILAKMASMNGKVVWQCRCPCGTEFQAAGTYLRSGKAHGCNQCSKKRVIRAITKHGAIGTREYVTYSAMKSCCYNPKDKRYDRYGGRGITICSRWMESFNNFLSDMGQKPSKEHSIERLEVDKGYEPGNCIWATLSEQANNRSNNTRIEINSVTKNLTQWSRETGVCRTVILRRMKRGLSGEALVAQTKPTRITFNGITDSFAGWAKRTGIKASTLSQRITGYGWSVETALTTKANHENS